MKNRKKQRHNRKIKEEMLDRKDMCGLNDPTPYEAVKEIIKEFKKKQCQMQQQYITLQMALKRDLQ